MNLGENIYRFRTGKNMSQGDLADALDVSRQSVSKWENNNAVPDLDRLVKMADLFGISLDELVKGEKPAEAPAKNIIEEKQVIPQQRIVGIILLCFGLLLVLMLLWATSLSAIVTCLIVAAPVIACGIICLKAKHHPWLYCLLVIYGWLWLPMGILSASYINYNAARVAKTLHMFWGIWLMVEGLLLKRQGKFFQRKKSVILYFALLSVTIALTLLFFRFPGLLPTPGLLHS